MRRVTSSTLCVAVATASLASFGCDTGEPAAPVASVQGADAGASSPPAPAPERTPRSGGEVLTSKNDNGRTGANLDETTLDHASVKRLALAATLPVDGELYAQPLVAVDVETPSGKKSLLIAATMNDSVYAYDIDAPDGSPPVWHTGPAGELGSPGTSRRNVFGPNGILSTPVIDRAREVVWVVSRDCSKTERTTFDRCGTPTEVPRCRERLSSLSLRTGEVLSSVDIEGAVWSDTRRVAFDPSVQWNRPALLLAGDHLFVAFGSGPNADDHEEDYEYHGWLFRYDARSPEAPPAIFATTPRSSGGSIWQAGAGPASDGEHVYFATANGILGCTTHAPSGFPAAPTDAEDSVVRLPLSYAETDLRATSGDPPPTVSELGTVSTRGDALVYSDTRAYTASGYSGTVFQFTNAGDCGFGSSGPTLIPGSRDLVVSSKGGLIYLLDRDTMKPRQAPLSPFDLLPLQGDHTLYIHSWWGIPMLPGALAFYRVTSEHGLVYGWPKHDKLRSFRYDYASRTLEPDRAADVRGGDQGGYLSVSADGMRPGTAILWATTTGGAGGGGRAIAFDAITLAELWSADTPAFSKFTPPTVARGRLFVPSAKHGGSTAVLVYAPR